jgi:hypothetical protein
MAYSRTPDDQLIRPTVHMNGSGVENLMKDYLKSLTTLRLAIETLCNAAPHPRDYYVRGEEAIHAAKKQHHARVQAVQDVYAEIEALALGVRK